MDNPDFRLTVNSLLIIKGESIWCSEKLKKAAWKCSIASDPERRAVSSGLLKAGNLIDRANEEIARALAALNTEGINDELEQGNTEVPEG